MNAFLDVSPGFLDVHSTGVYEALDDSRTKRRLPREHIK
jgi:hypothetical protein